MSFHITQKLLALSVTFVLLSTIGGCATLKRPSSNKAEGEIPRENELYLNQPNLKKLIIGNEEERERGDLGVKEKNQSENLPRRERRTKQPALEQDQSNDFPAERKFHAAPLSPKRPPLSEPKIKSIWVEEQIRGNRLVEGHYECVIEEPSKWEK